MYSTGGALMESVNAIISKGKAMREAGLIKESLTLFDQALSGVLTDTNKALLRIQLGLSYMKLPDFNMAYRHFDLAFEYAKRANLSILASESQRHMSIALLHMGQYAEALRLASAALGEARKWSVFNLPWFTQACVEVVLKMNLTKTQKWSWVHEELKDLVSVYWKEPAQKVKIEWLRQLFKHSWIVFWSK